MGSQKASAISYVLRGPVLKRNLIIAVVVGTLLSLANQFEALLSGPWTLGLAVKILINFVIPFVVASVSSAINREKHSP
ncbi:MAG: hypothetical protein ACE5IP_00220 [Terriglobia bacterium]